MPPLELGLPDNSLTLVSFDPYSYRIDQPQYEPDDGWLYETDLLLVRESLARINGLSISGSFDPGVSPSIGPSSGACSIN